jgi:hypothetical protein
LMFQVIADRAEKAAVIVTTNLPFYADPSLMVTRQCTVEHPFGTIKRMSGGGRFFTRGLKAVKAEAALSILAFNMLHAVNAFGAERLTRTR